MVHLPVGEGELVHVPVLGTSGEWTCHQMVEGENRSCLAQRVELSGYTHAEIAAGVDPVVLTPRSSPGSVESRFWSQAALVVWWCSCSVGGM